MSQPKMTPKRTTAKSMAPFIASFMITPAVLMAQTTQPASGLSSAN